MGARPLNPAQKQALNEALNIAIQAQDLDMMSNAVDSGADANILMFRGIQNRQINWVKSAVEHGADVNASMNGLSSSGQILQSYNSYPVFFWLARYMDPDIGDYLLSKGAKIDALSREGDSALMAAVRMQDSVAVKYLVEKGADPLLICAEQKFPLKVLEDNSDWPLSSRVPLLKVMMENLKKQAAASGAAPAPANDTSAAASTQQDIEISRPLELKRSKPKQGFEL